MATEELQVKIGADASELVKETTRARDAFGRFASSVEKSAEGVEESSERARDAFGRFVKSTESGAAKSKRAENAFQRLGNAASRGAKRVRELANRIGNIGVKALRAGFRGLTSIVGLATKGLVAFGVALAGIGVAATVSFARFQTEFAQVRTLVDESVVDVQALEDGVRRLSRTFGVDLIEATEAAYQAISAGQDPATVIQFLEDSFKGAAAGAASTGEAVDLFTTVINAFGAAAGDTTRVADVLFATIKAGKTTATELAASLGQVAPVAASAGVSLEETAAAIATLTASGLNTAEATTALKSALVGILKPSADAAANLARIGVSADSLRVAGFGDAIARIRDAVESGNGAVIDFLPNQRALIAGAVLAGEGFDKFTESLDATTNAAGAAAEAFAKVESTTAFQFNRLRRTVEDTFREIGSVIDPFAARAIRAFSEFTTSARSEVEILGNVLSRRFTPIVEDAFGTLERSAGESGDVASRALGLVSDAFEVVSRAVDRATPVIATLVATFETVGDVVKVVGNVLKTGFLVVLTGLSAAVTGFIVAAEGLAKALGLDVAKGLEEARIAAAVFTRGLAKDTVKATEDVAKSVEDFADAGDVYTDAAFAVNGFSKSLARAAEGVRDLDQEVAAARAIQRQEEEIEAAIRAVEELGKASGDAAEGQQDLGDETKDTTIALTQFDTATTASKSNTDLLRESLERARIAAGGVGEAATRASAGLTSLDQSAGAARSSAESLGVGVGMARSSIGDLSLKVQAADMNARAFADTITGTLALAILDLGVGIDVTTDKVTKIAGALEAVQSDARLTRESLVILATTLTGEFQEAGDRAAVALSKGNVSARQFREEIERLTVAQRSAALGISELFAPLEKLGVGFKALATLAGEARASIGQRLREGFDQFRDSLTGAAGDADRLIDKIFELGRRQTELAGLNDVAVTAFDRLSESNRSLADSVLDVSRGIGSEFRPQLDALLEAFNRGVIGAEALEKGIEKLNRESGRLVELPIQEFTLSFVTGLDQIADSADSATDAVKALTAATEDATRRAEQLAREQSRVQGLGFGSGRRPGGESRGEITGRLRGAFGFGIRPGRSVGRVNVGAGVFQDGGPVLQTGRPDVEAGEFILSQRGLADLGRTFADLLNRGRSGAVTVNQTNNFPVSGATPGGTGEDAITELAFKLRPALLQTGRLAASQSPVT